MSDLARWTCHKIVSAGEIRGLLYPEHGLRVRTADGRWKEIFPGEKFFARGEPALGDYFVEYEDGYVSWSPKAAFEAGYTRIAD